MKFGVRGKTDLLFHKKKLPKSFDLYCAKLIELIIAKGLFTKEHK